MEQPVQASRAQVERFIDDFTEGDSNNRPVKPTNGRAILKGE
jgi:carbonic anhydrase